jgi:hypothetical protein
MLKRPGKETGFDTSIQIGGINKMQREDNIPQQLSYI